MHAGIALDHHPADPYPTQASPAPGGSSGPAPGGSSGLAAAGTPAVPSKGRYLCA